MPQDDTTVSDQMPQEQPKKKGLFFNPFAKREATVTPQEIESAVIMPDDEHTTPTPAPAPISAAIPTISTPPPVPPPVAPVVTTASVGLSALRERVMTEHASVAATPPPAISQTTPQAPPSSLKPHVNILTGEAIPEKTPTEPQKNLQQPPEQKEPIFVHNFNPTAMRAEEAGGISPLAVPLLKGQKPAASNSSIKSLRTLKDDMSQVITRRQVSLVSALAAEEKKRGRELDAMPAGKKGILSPAAYFILGIVVSLLVLGGAALAVGFLFTKKAPVISKQDIPSYIFTEGQTQLSLDNKTRLSIMNDLMAMKNNLNTTVGTITHVYFTKTQAGMPGAKGTLALVTTDEWFNKMDMHAPGQLTRSLVQQMMFGFHEFDEARPFLILKTSSYENAFAGMLEWESSLNADLAPLFGPIAARKVTPIPREAEPLPVVIATSSTSTQTQTSTPIKIKTTSSTTPSSSPSVITLGEPATTTPEPPVPNLYIPQQFTDAVIHNVEVRVLKNDDGHIVLIYGFFDPNTLIITNDDNTFKEIVVRLSSRR